MTRSAILLMHLIKKEAKREQTDMGKKSLRKRIESLLRRVEEHEQKIRNEMSKEYPDYGLWKTEIAAVHTSIKRARKRLKS